MEKYQPNSKIAKSKNDIKKGMIVRPKWATIEDYAFYVTEVKDNGEVRCQRQRIDGSRHETHYHWTELEIIGKAQV